MHYVKHFEMNGVDTKQVACIELQGKPNAATEGAVGLLGIDVSSPTHEVYKCVAVNGSIYTWELLSSGLSIMSASDSGNGASTWSVSYDDLNTPEGYVVKIGDLIVDAECYLYRIYSLSSKSCRARYCNIAFTQGQPGLTPHIGENGHWWIGDTDTGVIAPATFRYEKGAYEGTGTYGKDNPNSLTFSFEPKLVIITTDRIACQMILINGVQIGYNHCSDTVYFDDGKVYRNNVEWEGNMVRWYYEGGPLAEIAQLNGKYYVVENDVQTVHPHIYHYIAIG